jgi:hypothetical protein
MHITFKGSVMNGYNNVASDLIESVIKSTSEAGLTLFLYYHSKEQTFKWRDTAVAESLGWSVPKLERTKKALKDAGWIDYWKHAGSVYYYIGKDRVKQSAIDRAEAGKNAV